jgi:hypothetical protein
MFPRKNPPPFWFELCVAVAIGCLLRRWSGELLSSGPAGGHAPDTQVAFWFFLVAIAEAIWKGLEVAGKVTLTALSWSVKALWWFATTTANGLKIVGQGLLVGLKKTWEFFRLTYDKVIKPGLLKLWSWFKKFKQWLDDTFGPVLRFLKSVRDNLLCFYKTWIRPWLDLIDVTRKMLRIFSSLGLKWASALDKKLGELETAIERPFRLVLAKLNEVITIVNRIVTIDGLIQRVALVGSLQRDYQFAWRAMVNPWHRLLSDDDRKIGEQGKDPATVAAVAKSTRAYMLDRSGPDAALLDEMRAQWRIYLRS